MEAKATNFAILSSCRKANLRARRLEFISEGRTADIRRLIRTTMTKTMVFDTVMTVINVTPQTAMAKELTVSVSVTGNQSN